MSACLRASVSEASLQLLVATCSSAAKASNEVVLPDSDPAPSSWVLEMSGAGDLRRPRRDRASLGDMQGLVEGVSTGLDSLYESLRGVIGEMGEVWLLASSDGIGPSLCSTTLSCSSGTAAKEALSDCGLMAEVLSRDESRLGKCRW